MQQQSPVVLYHTHSKAVYHVHFILKLFGLPRKEQIYKFRSKTKGISYKIIRT